MDLSFKKYLQTFKIFIDNEFEHDIINKNTAQERNVIKNIMKSFRYYKNNNKRRNFIRRYHISKFKFTRLI